MTHASTTNPRSQLPRPLRWARGVDRWLSRFEEVALALILLSMIALASLQAILRARNAGLDWADVVLQNATLLVGLLGAALATHEGRHLNVDIASRLLKGRAKLGLQLIITAFALLICTALARGGFQAYEATHDLWLTNLPAGTSAFALLRTELSEGGFAPWLTQMMLCGGFVLIGAHFFLRMIVLTHSVFCRQDCTAPPAEPRPADGTASS